MALFLSSMKNLEIFELWQPLTFSKRTHANCIICAMHIIKFLKIKAIESLAFVSHTWQTKRESLFHKSKAHTRSKQNIHFCQVQELWEANKNKNGRQRRLFALFPLCGSIFCILFPSSLVLNLIGIVISWNWSQMHSNTLFDFVLPTFAADTGSGKRQNFQKSVACNDPCLDKCALNVIQPSAFTRLLFGLTIAWMYNTRMLHASHDSSMVKCWILCAVHAALDIAFCLCSMPCCHLWMQQMDICAKGSVPWVQMEGTWWAMCTPQWTAMLLLCDLQWWQKSVCSSMMQPQHWKIIASFAMEINLEDKWIKLYKMLAMCVLIGSNLKMESKMLKTSLLMMTDLWWKQMTHCHHLCRKHSICIDQTGFSNWFLHSKFLL